MRLGKLITELEKCSPNAIVSYDFCSFSPHGLDSFRGYYDQLAFGYSEQADPKVSTILEQLKNAVGKTYQGYKGGDFVMDLETNVWVANYGSSSYTTISGVRNISEYTVILETEYVND